MIEPVKFNGFINNQQNIFTLEAKLNEVISYLNQQEAVSNECEHHNAYQMKPGVWRCKECKKVFKKEA